MGTKRFAITCSDRYIGIFNAFIEAGWEPVKLFTAPINSHMASNQQVIDLAHSRKIPIQLSRMNDHDLQELQQSGCDLLVLASYQWRVGHWEKFLPRAINFHPAPLPGYRGPYPLVQGVLDRQARWAITCHKVAAEFDTGDVLAIRHFDLTPEECHESLDLKCQMVGKQLALMVANNLEALWDAAFPQGEGRYVKLWTDADREIDFNASAHDIELQLRAFGNFECMASLNGMRLFVRRALCWLGVPKCAPGSLVHVDGMHYVVACKDGFVALLDWSLVPPGVKVDAPTR